MLENEIKTETLPEETPSQENEKAKGKTKMTKALIELVCKTAAEAAVKAYSEEHEKHRVKVRDKRYNNTKLLFKSYRALADYNENTIYDIAQMASENGDPELFSALGLMGESRKVESIRDRVVFTRVAMENIAIAFETYRLWCERSDKPEVKRRWRVLEKMYLDRKCELTPQEVADSEHISLSQVYVDIDNAAKDMEKRLFGLDPEIFD